MDSREVRAISRQLLPLARAFRQIHNMTGVPNGNRDHETFDERLVPSHTHENGGRWTYGSGLVSFSKIRPRAGTGWIRRFGEPKETSTETLEALRKSWTNESASPIEVVLDETVEIAEGVQSVQTDESTWGSNWEVGGRLKTTLSTEAKVGAGYGGITASASLSASVEAEISAKGGGSQGGKTGSQDTSKSTTTKSRSIKQSFTVQPCRKFDLSAIYDKSTLVIPCTDRLPIDVAFKGIPSWAGGELYNRYWAFGQGDAPDKLYPFGDSLDAWLNGFFGVSNRSFRPGLDITFSSDPVDVAVRDLIDAMRSDCLLYTSPSPRDS